LPWVKRILAVGKIRRAVINSHSVLEDAGYSVAYAPDEAAACKLMSSLKFDLVVLSHSQKRALAMIAEIKRQHPTAVLALIHPYPDSDSPIAHLPPKSATLNPDRLLSELRFLFETHSGPTVRKAR
jgi:response regulator RpfG family c-di-GMP phosphodiesterase